MVEARGIIPNPDFHSIQRSTRTTMTMLATGEQIKTKSSYATLKEAGEDRGTVWRLLRFSEHDQIVFEYRELLLDSVQ